MLKSKINTKALSKRISGEIEEVGFANCYFDGGKLTVQIKEVHVKEEEEEYSKIVADRDCIITRVLVYSGTALVKAGDVVKKGRYSYRGIYRYCARYGRKRKTYRAGRRIGIRRNRIRQKNYDRR